MRLNLKQILGRLKPASAQPPDTAFNAADEHKIIFNPNKLVTNYAPWLKHVRRWVLITTIIALFVASGWWTILILAGVSKPPTLPFTTPGKAQNGVASGSSASPAGGSGQSKSKSKASNSTASSSPSGGSGSPGSGQQPPANAFWVTNYGADNTEVHDSTVAIRNTITAAEAAGPGNTVYFPAGSYLLNDNDGAKTDFKIDGIAVNILGAGRDTTKLVEKVGTVSYPSNGRGKNVFVFSHVSGFYVSGITIDSQTYNAGDTIDDFGDNSTIEHDQFLGAQNGSGTPVDNSNVFDMRVLAVCNQDPSNPLYGIHHSGNTVNDIILNGRGTGGNDDLDFSCQQNGTISNIVDTGWGTALYIDQNVTVTNYNFTPGSYETNPRGWYVTDSSNITINNFTTSGEGGIINSPNYPSNNITINNEVMTNPILALAVNDASNTKINNSRLNAVNINPSGSGTNAGTNGLTVTSSVVGSVSCKPQNGAPIIGLVGISCP
jgi:predicted secreted protein